ncbi:hypothetical protein B0H11DRAFT_2251890 [Mycena galericulata]|nr:hypothetical protein B0H11DRAFT_2251890 [Mycena galericulata]
MHAGQLVRELTWRGRVGGLPNAQSIVGESVGRRRGRFDAVVGKREISDAPLRLTSANRTLGAYRTRRITVGGGVRRIGESGVRELAVGGARPVTHARGSTDRSRPFFYDPRGLPPRGMHAAPRPIPIFSSLGALPPTQPARCPSRLLRNPDALPSLPPLRPVRLPGPFLRGPPSKHLRRTLTHRAHPVHLLAARWGSLPLFWNAQTAGSWSATSGAGYKRRPSGVKRPFLSLTATTTTTWRLPTTLASHTSSTHRRRPPMALGISTCSVSSVNSLCGASGALQDPAALRSRLAARTIRNAAAGSGRASAADNE